MHRNPQHTGRRAVSQTMILTRHPATDRFQPTHAGGLLCVSFQLKVQIIDRQALGSGGGVEGTVAGDERDRGSIDSLLQQPEFR